MRILLDTNVLVAAFATRGFCLDILQLVLAEHRLVVGRTIVEELERILAEKLRYAGKTGGDALFAPLDIVFDEYDVAQPDIVFFRAERRHLLRPDVAVRHPPDIAVEVLSPSTAAMDRGAKMRLFARHGVPEYWLVDPVHEQIEVHSLGDGSYRQAQVASGEDIVHSLLLPDLIFEAGRAFVR